YTATNGTAGTQCCDAGRHRTNQDTCSGTGTCVDNGYQASGTTCGSASDTECDNPDTCNGSGTCQVNNETAGTHCGDAGTQCTNQVGRAAGRGREQRQPQAATR